MEELRSRVQRLQGEATRAEEALAGSERERERMQEDREALRRELEELREWATRCVFGV